MADGRDSSYLLPVTPKESQYGFLGRRVGEMRRQPEQLSPAPPADPNIGTWSPAPAQVGVTQFAFQNRDAGLRRADYSDPTLLEGFTGPVRDQENYIGAQLLRRYKEDPTPERMENLMAHHDQIIGTTISRYARRGLPEPAVRGKVYNAFADAVEKYDFRAEEGGKPMQFHNYFMGNVGQSPVKRWADQLKGFAHVPAARAAKHDQVRVVVEQFQLDHGREPTVSELTNLTNGISSAELRRILPELKTTGVSSRNIRADFVVDESELWSRAVRNVRDGFPTGSVERAVLEDFFAPVFGLPDAKMSKGALAKKHGISASKLSKLFKRFRELNNEEMDRLRRDL